MVNTSRVSATDRRMLQWGVGLGPYPLGMRPKGTESKNALLLPYRIN